MNNEIMIHSGWGRFPVQQGELKQVQAPSRVLRMLSAATDHKSPELIARGMGRSYGDSALAPVMLDMRSMDQLLEFDPESGVLHCAAGTCLADLLAHFVPRGWFLPVTPGTSQVTIGGAIAADVHGKNHHLHGSLCDHLIDITIATPARGVVICSTTRHPDLYHATCAGMGLTGIILSARLQLIPIRSSLIRQTILKASNLEHALELFREHSNTTYSVAWIDCLSRGKALGRSLIMLGEHEEQGPLNAGETHALSMPFDPPFNPLTPATMRLFNWAYYQRISEPQQTDRVHYRPFFYPLDAIGNWNRLYGRKGFVQYQFVLPRAAGPLAMREVLERIAASGLGSFLAVLKSFGKGNNNLLSFPMEGLTLALDFALVPGLPDLLEELDRIVIGNGGRIYLAKDARMSRETFRAGYPKWEEFLRIREQWGARDLLHSRQSKRLGL